jgi:hypothetical protein
MFGRLMQFVMRIACGISGHRAVFTGLAAAYGAGCVGWLDKEMVNQNVTGLYVLLAAQRGH